MVEGVSPISHKADLSLQPVTNELKRKTQNKKN